MSERVALAAATAGFLGASAMLWRPLQVACGVSARALTAGTGTSALLAGLGLYLAGMAALGPAYDVSSTFWAQLHQVSASSRRDRTPSSVTRCTSGWRSRP